MTDTSREAVERLADWIQGSGIVREKTSPLFDAPATLRALLDRAERAEAGIAAAVAEEREANAVIADEWQKEAYRMPCAGLSGDWMEGFNDGAEATAAAIRARGTP